jgi:hypothetical protein
VKASNFQGGNYPAAPQNATKIAADVAWLNREFIAECGDLIASLGVSLSEAAYRGSDATCEVTLRQIIATTKAACSIFREIAASSEGGAL